MTPRFRYIGPDGQEHHASDLIELADAIRAAKIKPTTLLYDSKTGRWEQARNHDVFAALEAADSEPIKRGRGSGNARFSSERVRSWRTTSIPPSRNTEATGAAARSSKSESQDTSEDTDPFPQHQPPNRGPTISQKSATSSQKSATSELPTALAILVVMLMLAYGTKNTLKELVDPTLATIGAVAGISFLSWRRMRANRQVRTAALFGAGIAGAVILLWAVGLALGVSGEAIAGSIGQGLVTAALLSWPLSLVAKSLAPVRHPNGVRLAGAASIDRRLTQRGRSMGRIVWGLIAILLIGIVAAVAIRRFASANVSTKEVEPISAAGTADIIENPKVITSTDGQSQITVPGTWQKTSDLSKSAVIQAGDTRREQYVIVLAENKADLEPEVDLERYTQLVLRDYQEGLADVTVSAPRPNMIQGNSAIQYQLHFTSEGSRVVLWLTIIEGVENYYQVLTSTFASRVEADEPFYQRVIESFRETPR